MAVFVGMSIIDDYLQQFELPVRTELERIRSIAQAALPGYTETITYGMPTICYQGKSIIGFDGHTHHIGIYPFSSEVIATTAALKNYSTTKGAIQEKLDNLLPESLITEIIRARVKQAGL